MGLCNVVPRTTDGRGSRALLKREYGKSFFLVASNKLVHLETLRGCEREKMRGFGPAVTANLGFAPPSGL